MKNKPDLIEKRRRHATDYCLQSRGKIGATETGAIGGIRLRAVQEETDGYY